MGTIDKKVGVGLPSDNFLESNLHICPSIININVRRCAVRPYANIGAHVIPVLWVCYITVPRQIDNFCTDLGNYRNEL